MKPLLASLLAALLGFGCAVAGPQNYNQPPGYPPVQHRMTAQGWIGISEVETEDIATHSNVGNVVEVDEASMPAIGGAFMRPIGGDKLIYGIEGGINFGWQGGVNSVAIGNGAVAISADSDIFLTDFFGGPYIALPIGQSLRLYFATGLVLEWGWFDIDWDDPSAGHVSFDQDGIGGGYYGRTGFEFNLGHGSSIGLGLRVVDTSINPGGEIDTIELRQVQYLLTVTQSI